MEPEEVKRVFEILDGVHGLSESELKAYLDRECGEHSALRREVLSYLKYDVEQKAHGAGTAGTDSGSVPEIPDATASESQHGLDDESSEAQ